MSSMSTEEERIPPDRLYHKITLLTKFVAEQTELQCSEANIDFNRVNELGEKINAKWQEIWRAYANLYEKVYGVWGENLRDTVEEGGAIMLTNITTRTSADFEDSEGDVCTLVVKNGLLQMRPAPDHRWITASRELARDLARVLLNFAETGNLIDDEETKQ